jgi:hypothetical protein
MRPLGFGRLPLPLELDVKFKIASLLKPLPKRLYNGTSCTLSPALTAPVVISICGYRNRNAHEMPQGGRLGF